MTDELKQDVYPAATLEGTYGSGTAAADVEKNYYTINNGDIVASSTATGIPTYQNNNTIPNNNPNGSPTANSAKLYLLNATTSKTGLGITLKVMSGDKIDVFGKSYYFQNNAGDGSGYNLAALDILTALIGSPQGSTTAVHGAVSASDLNGISGTPVGTFLSGGGRTPTNTSTPRAYINYIILDEQFHYVSGGFSSVGTNGTVKDHYSELQDIAINKNGYIFIYCSNESPVNVFFDNLQVVHTRGPLLEETHYYPFGLTMAGISSKAAGSLINRNKFTGKELQSGEFSDGSGLEWYDYGARRYDAQICRWQTIDPMAESMTRFSPYNYAFNNPINFIDPDGMAPKWNGEYGDNSKYIDNKTGKEVSWEEAQRYYEFGDYAMQKNFIVLNPYLHHETSDITKMAENNANWTILSGHNGDISSAASTISEYASNGGEVDNVILDTHGNIGLIAFSNKGEPRSVIITNAIVDQYRKTGKVDNAHASIIIKFLNSLKDIANSISNKGNFISTACGAGWSPTGERGLAISLFDFFKNSGINILLNRNDTYSEAGNNIPFGRPLTAQEPGVISSWSVANKLSNSARSGNGDIQLNKTGAAVTFLGAVYQLLNR